LASTTMDDYLRKLQQDEIKNLQDTSRKRKYGLAKKAEQFRRITGSDVALLIYDRVSQQYYTYRSKEEDNWPPSMSEIVSSPFSVCSPHTHRHHLEASCSNVREHSPRRFHNELSKKQHRKSYAQNDARHSAPKAC